MTMYTETVWIFLIMVVTFVLSSWKLKSAEISMVITAIVGGIAGLVISKLPFEPRFVVEGMFTYLDLTLTFITATIFINIYSKTGSLNNIVRTLVSKFYKTKWILFFFLAILMLIPGALTGAGSVSILVMGGMVATVLGYMGIEKTKITGFVFIMAILSAAAPPINLWAMLMAAGANMPYVGFDLLLLVPVVLVMIVAVFSMLRKGVPQSKEDILASLPPKTEGMGLLRIAIPPIFLIGIILLSKYAAFKVPVFGLPFTFVMCTIVALLCSVKKLKLSEIWDVISKTVEQVFPLVATLISVGVLVTFMTYTGVRGLIAITFITLPILLTYPMVLFFGPFAQGSLSYGSAVIIGTPLIFLFNTLGRDTTITAAALSLIFPIGDCLPPSRIVARLAIETVGYEGGYLKFLKSLIIPIVVLAAYAMTMLVNYRWFSFLK